MTFHGSMVLSLTILCQLLWHNMLPQRVESKVLLVFRSYCLCQKEKVLVICSFWHMFCKIGFVGFWRRGSVRGLCHRLQRLPCLWPKRFVKVSWALPGRVQQACIFVFLALVRDPGTIVWGLREWTGFQTWIASMLLSRLNKVQLSRWRNSGFYITNFS